VIKGVTHRRAAPEIRQRHKATSGSPTISGQPSPRFNGFARQGRDEDFHRGERPVELLFNGPTAAKTGKNPTMYPISGKGPYYAALMTGGNLDTKGGPATNPDGQVLDSLGAVIPGLYGVGNCVASASGRGYWAGGGTLGPFMAFADLAANAASREGRSERAGRREAT
jgi:3-oxosteroid 1-dehydrogenase